MDWNPSKILVNNNNLINIYWDFNPTIVTKEYLFKNFFRLSRIWLGFN